jgi:molybdopterin-containing oxidoreductase family membrane subunit
MLEKALYGSKKYWALMIFLLAVAGLGGIAYLKQYFYGLGLTGMGRDISWGIYIAQFTFLVGVAASAVMLVLPYYLHNYKAFGKIVILGEFLAISAVMMCILFIMADMGKPERVLNVLRYPTLNSVMFWDMMVLSGYLGLNLLCGWVVLQAEKKDIPPPKWVKPFIYISIPWAVSIHTVTAFLYAGLPGRHFWLTAIMAPRFLSSAFAAGPSLLILLALIVRKYTSFDAGREAIRKLAVIVTYAAVINVFFLLMEVFTSFYSGIPGHMHTFQYLFAGLEGKGNLVPLMWTSVVLGVAAIFMLLFPSTRENYGRLAAACAMLFTSLLIDKGVGLVIGGFIPNMFERVLDYHPTRWEIMITLGIWAAGFLILTVLYKVAVTVKEEAA